MKFEKIDKLWFGILIGFLLPFLAMVIFYYSSYAYLTAPEFMRKMAFQAVWLKLLSVCAVVNLGAFFIFYHYKIDKAARGVVLSTLVMALFVMSYKILSGTL